LLFYCPTFSRCFFGVHLIVVLSSFNCPPHLFPGFPLLVMTPTCLCSPTLHNVRARINSFFVLAPVIVLLSRGQTKDFFPVKHEVESVFFHISRTFWLRFFFPRLRSRCPRSPFFPRRFRPSLSRLDDLHCVPKIFPSSIFP